MAKKSRTGWLMIVVIAVGAIYLLTRRKVSPITPPMPPPWPPELPGLPVRDDVGRWLFVELRRPDGSTWQVTADSMMEYPPGLIRPLWQYLVEVEGNAVIGYHYEF